jgi:nitrite reductase (cytochrome c-552)
MKRIILITAAVTTVVAGGLTALLLNVAEHKQEAKNPFFRVVDLADDTENPETWGKNFPLQYDGYARTTDQSGRSTAAARPCRARRRRPIPAAWSPSRAWRKIPG